jgi:hypothetical protein
VNLAATPTRWPNARSAFASIALSLPAALAMSAVAALVVGLASMPVTLVVTRDVYVALLAPSYALAVASQAAPALLVTTLIWSIVASVLETRPARWSAPAWAGAQIALSAVIALATPLALWALFPDARVSGLFAAGAANETALPFIALAALLAGAVGGLSSVYRQRRAAPADTWNAIARRAWGDSAWYSFGLATIIVTGGVILAALGVI